MSGGNITRRGAHSWRIKYDDAPDATGTRRTRFVTVRGTRRQAQAELTRLLSARDNGTAVVPSAITFAEYLRSWLDADRDLSARTAERYRELIDQQIIPTLGAVPLQKLRPSAV